MPTMDNSLWIKNKKETVALVTNTLIDRSKNRTQSSRNFYTPFYKNILENTSLGRREFTQQEREFGRILAGTFGDGSANIDGIGTNAKFIILSDIVYKPNTDLFFIATRGTTIRQFNKSTNEVSTLAGSATSGYTNGNLSTSTFTNVFGLAYDPVNQFLYVGDLSYGIRKIDLTTNTVSTVITNASYAYNSMCYSNGFIYLADYATQKVYKINLASPSVDFIAGSGSLGATDGTGASASFNFGYSSSSITTDGSGNLYTVQDNIIRKIVISTGNVSTIKTLSASVTGIEYSSINSSLYISSSKLSRIPLDTLVEEVLATIPYYFAVVSPTSIYAIDDINKVIREYSST